MRDIPVGNGSLLVTFDDKYRIRDIYFPHVGQENHTEGFAFRFGVWVDGSISWVSDDEWKRTIRYIPETLVTDVHLINEKIGIELVSHDTVANHDNVFLRKLYVSNLLDKHRDVRVFFHHDFHIYENEVGDTAFYDPESHSLVHYKKHRYFLINTDPPFDHFATGRKGFQDKEGTWRDAEDGHLEGGAITEGSVDSTIQVNLELEAQQTLEFFYWIAAGTTNDEVTVLNDWVITNPASRVLDREQNYWHVWVNKNERDFCGLSSTCTRLYKRSLLIIKTQVDNGGAILAANDSDVTDRATDHYSYLWTRDGAFVANALDLAGYPYLTRRFFRFCESIVHKNGYFLQKYNPDGTVASGWHAAWDVWAKKKQVPIQEDETALVLWSLWEHYSKFRELGFSSMLYRSLITKCSEFVVGFFDDELGLPKPSWNLWEDRRGIHTFTCSTVVGGLRAAANFAHLFGEPERAEHYESVAKRIVKGMRDHLWSEGHGHFFRALNVNGDQTYDPDAVLDSSMFGLFYFGAFDANDEMVVSTMEKIKETLWVSGEIGGLARFENDGYMRVSDQYTGNPWFICTLWLAEWYIAKARTTAELEQANELLEWAADRALPSGVMAEQLDPQTGEPVSVSPLTWSHSTFVAVVENYRAKVCELHESDKPNE
ncbi:MAG: glycoside hydrolase family 15 protein, partial [Acidobacteriota bacterium]|nr:glycoside hydrolase family 15 protein [Acidobacteriota bacterium]